MPEWMATRILALLLGLSGGFAAHAFLAKVTGDVLTPYRTNHKPFSSDTSPCRRTVFRFALLAFPNLRAREAKLRRHVPVRPHMRRTRRRRPRAAPPRLR